MLTEAVNALILQTIEQENPDAFVVDISFTRSSMSGLNIRVDTDKGISLAECTEISRALGRALEEHEDMDFPYRLEVSSPGVGFPLKLHRQYVQNVNRHLSVIKQDGQEIKGKLLAVDSQGLTLELLVEKKGKKKGNQAADTQEQMPQLIPFNEIKESKVIILF